MRSLSLLLLIFLSACGGGGSSSTSTPIPPTPQNTAPTITVGSSFSIFEGDTFSTAVSTSDADGDNVTVSISGDDANLFTYSGGQLLLNSTVDFETLTTNGGQNILSIILTANDGSDSTSQTIQLTINDALEGRVVDGPVAGAQVFLDLNNNLELDANETLFTSNADGYFVLKQTVPSGVNLVSIGGTDTISNQELTDTVFVFPLNETASLGFANVSPISTLVALSSPEVVQTLLNSVDSNLIVESLLISDTWEEARAASVTAEKAQVLNTQLISVINSVKAVSGQNTQTTLANVARVLTESTDPEILTKLVQTETVNQVLSDAIAQTPDLVVDAQVLDVLSQSVAVINDTIAQNQSLITSDDIIQVVIVIQEELPGKVAQVINGIISVAGFVEEMNQIRNSAVVDSDDDGVQNTDDAFPNDPTETRDTDNDGIGNNSDSDDDGDGVADRDDAFPLDSKETLDTDLDGIGNNSDTDDDNDGVLDISDVYQLISIGDLTDTDSDGAPDNCDAACVALGMAADSDDDNDGVLDTADAYPLIAIGELTDTDADGAPNACDAACVALGMAADSDDDNDGLLDTADAYPLIAIGELTDTDLDGAPDTCNIACVELGMAEDSDDDNDGVLDATDVFPFDANLSSGIILENYTWPSGSNIYINGRVQIASEVTVTIQSDSIIEGNNNQIDVFGELNILGIYNNEVQVRDLHINPGNNEPSESFRINIVYSHLNGGSLYDATGRAIYGSLTLKRSLINYDGRNRIYLWYPTSDVMIEYNKFIGDFVISAGHRDANVYIRHNIFTLYKSEVIENWAAYEDTRTVVEFNTFAEVGIPTVKLPSGYSSAALTAANNYWGSSNKQFIENMIFDRNDDLSSAGIIPFEPYLTEPDSSTTLLESSEPLSTAERDSDGDGAFDNNDAFIFDYFESVDTDLDGIGNNTDEDDDGDGVLDINDVFPLDSSESTDTDTDGIGDNSDNCVDVSNVEQLDNDNDGQGDVCDNDNDNDGLLNEDELENGTNPFLGDSDLDSINDRWDEFPLDPSKARVFSLNSINDELQHYSSDRLCVYDPVNGTIWKNNSDSSPSFTSPDQITSKLQSLEGTCDIQNWALPSISELLALLNYNSGSEKSSVFSNQITPAPDGYISSNRFEDFYIFTTNMDTFKDDFIERVNPFFGTIKSRDIYKDHLLVNFLLTEKLATGIYGSDTDNDGIEDYQDNDSPSLIIDIDNDGLNDEIDLNVGEIGPYFIKLTNDLTIVPYDSDDGWYECVYDVKNQLLWEKKTKDDTVRSAYKRLNYPEENINEPSENVYTLLDEINTDELCGQNNWDIPSINELISLRYLNSRTTLESYFNDVVSFHKSGFEVMQFWSSTKLDATIPHGGHGGYKGQFYYLQTTDKLESGGSASVGLLERRHERIMKAVSRVNLKRQLR